MNAQHDDLKVVGLKRSWSDFVLEADFYVGAGERAALVGRSGSGKTSLLRMIAGLETIDQGRIGLGGTDLSALPTRERQVGFVFQDQALFPYMSVLENVVFALRMRGMGREEREALGLEWLQKVDLASRARSSIEHLSGGERQRVAFVRALVWKPKLLLLDEPFSALDRELRIELSRELLELHRLCLVPMILVTHDQADVDALAQVRLEVVQQGNSIERRVTRV